MRRAGAVALAAVLLSACVAVTVERHRPRRGPVKEVGYVDFGGGQVRYSAEGWSWIVSSRRKTALKLMSVNCGPDLEPGIIDEYSRMDADASYNGEDIDASMKMGDEHYHIERYIHLAYECRPRSAPTPSVSTATAAVGLSTAAAVAPSTGVVSVPTTSSATLPAPESKR